MGHPRGAAGGDRRDRTGDPPARRGEILIAEFIFGRVFLEYAGATGFAAPRSDRPRLPLAETLAGFIFSPIGLIDLVVVVVSLAPFFVANAAVLRVIRLLRIVSIMKFSRRGSAAMREIRAALRERSYELVCATLALVLVLLGAAGLLSGSRATCSPSSSARSRARCGGR